MTFREIFFFLNVLIIKCTNRYNFAATIRAKPGNPASII